MHAFVVLPVPFQQPGSLVTATTMPTKRAGRAGAASPRPCKVTRMGTAGNALDIEALPSLEDPWRLKIM